MYRFSKRKYAMRCKECNGIGYTDHGEHYKNDDFLTTVFNTITKTPEKEPCNWCGGKGELPKGWSAGWYGPIWVNYASVKCQHCGRRQWWKHTMTWNCHYCGRHFGY
jgi:hypothetical protein